MEKKDIVLALIDVKNCFGKIRWFLEYGTLLGAIREKGILDNEHDMDIGVFAGTPFPRECLEKAGFHVTEHENHWFIERGPIPCNVVKFYEGEVYMRKEMICSKLKRWLYYDKAHFRTLSVATIDGIKFPVPSFPELYLTLLYGDWRTPKPDWLHKFTGDIFRPAAVNLALNVPKEMWHA